MITTHIGRSTEADGPARIQGWELQRLAMGDDIDAKGGPPIRTREHGEQLPSRLRFEIGEHRRCAGGSRGGEHPSDRWC